MPKVAERPLENAEDEALAHSMAKRNLLYDRASYLYNQMKQQAEKGETDDQTP